MEVHDEFKIRLLIALILSIIFILSCVSEDKIKIPVSKPEPHPKLAQMQSMSIEEKDGVIYFGESKKYKK